MGTFEPDDGSASSTFEPEKPSAPRAFLERLKLGQRQDEATKRAAETIGAIKEGFGTEPLGWSDEHTKQLIDAGILHDPDKPGVTPLRLLSDSLIYQVPKVADALMRGVNAGLYGVATELKHAVTDVAGETQGQKAKNELINFGNYTMVDTMAKGPLTRAVHDPIQGVREEQVGGLPVHQDFQNAMRIARGGDVSPVMETKLRQLWQDKGLHPAEVIADAERDPVLKQQLLSDDPTTMPERYGIMEDRVLPDWDNWDADSKRAMVTRRTEDGDVIPTNAHEIADYLQEFGREAGFKFQVGPERQEILGKPFGIEAGPMFQAISYDFRGGGRAKTYAHVYMSDDPDYKMRAWYGLGRSEVLFHEVGHALDYFVLNRGHRNSKMGDLSPALAEELTEASKRFAPKLWADSPTYRKKPEEFMADGIAAWLSNPEIRKDMPLFTAKYGRLLDKYRKIAEQALPKKVGDTWEPPPPKEPSKDVVGGGGGGQPPGPPGWFEHPGPPEKPIVEGSLEEAQGKINDRISVGESERKRPYSLDRLYTDYVDKWFPIAKEVKASTVKPELAANDPYKLARLFAGWAGKADYMIERGTFDLHTYQDTGPALRSILDPIKDDLEGFRAFVTSLRAAELEHRGIVSGFNDLGPEVGKVIKDGLANKKFKNAAEQLIKYQNNVTAYLRDSGVLNDRAYEAMLEANKLYVPFHRVMGEEDFVKRLGGSMQARNPVKSISGSERIVVDPVESVIKNTYLLTQMAEKNVVGTKLIDMLLEGRADVAREGRAPEMLKLPAPKGEVGDIKGFLQNEGMVGHNGGPAIDDLARVLREAAEPSAEDTITIFRDGARESYRVDRELASAMKGLNAETVGTLERLFKPFASSLRAGAVLNPEFQIRHTLRDFTYAFVTTTKGVFTPLDMARGFTGLITKDADFWNWQKGGGGQVSWVSLDRSYLQEKLETLTDQTGLFTRSWNTVIDPNATWLQKGKGVLGLGFAPVSRYVIHPLQVATEMALSASHLAAYKKAARRMEAQSPEAVAGRTANLPATIDMGGLPATQDYTLAPGVSLKDALKTDSLGKQQIIEAAWVSRDTSIDGQRIGAKMRSLNMISAFANAKVQDTDTVLRLLKDHPIRGLMTVGAGITLPSMLLWSVNHDDSRYKALLPWEKDIFWHFLTDKWEPSTQEMAAVRPPDQVRIMNGQVMVNNGHIFRWPKPFGAGVVFGSLPERLMEKFIAENPNGLKGFMGALAESTVGDLAPNALAPIMDQLGNQSMFSGRTLIPSALEKQLPEYQYTPYTTETAKALGRITSSFPGMQEAGIDRESPVKGGAARALTSPILIENYVRGWTGQLGIYALKTADYGLRKAGVVADPSHAESTLADVPVVRAFVSRYPSASTASLAEFHEAYSANKRLYDTWYAQAKEGNVAATQRLQEAGGAAMFARLDGYNKVVGDHIRMIQMIDKNPSMKDTEKRQLIDWYYYSAIRVGQQGVALMRQIKEGEKRE